LTLIKWVIKVNIFREPSYTVKWSNFCRQCGTFAVKYWLLIIPLSIFHLNDPFECYTVAICAMTPGWEAKKFGFWPPLPTWKFLNTKLVCFQVTKDYSQRRYNCGTFHKHRLPHHCSQMSKLAYKHHLLKHSVGNRSPIWTQNSVLTRHESRLD
jgi:hypothetical protein